MNKEYYIWHISNIDIAQAALDFINSNPRLPITGKNAKTGQPEPNKQKTTSWTKELTFFGDDKVGFQRVPDQLLSSLGVDEVERQQFFDTFSPTIEIPDQS